MENTPNKVNLNSNKVHRVETEEYTSTHCGFEGRKNMGYEEDSEMESWRLHGKPSEWVDFR